MDAGDDVALDQPPLLLRGLAQRGRREAIELAHGAGGGLVQERSGVGGEELALATGAAQLELPVGHPQRERFRCMARMTAAEDYEAQKQLLDQKHEKEGVDVFVGSYLLLRNTATGEVNSLSTWAWNAVSLLPRTDEIAIAAGPQGAPDLTLPWESVAEIVGDLLQPQGLVPERYRVARSPTPQQLERLGSAVKTT